MGYQSFPWQRGDSRSFEKLVCLYLPALKGRSLLDVGCNTGYFCGWAAFQGAGRVRGIDRDPNFIAQARLFSPNCSFACMSWQDLGPELYDVVLCLSAIHYAENQKELIDALMRRVRPGGLFVLELGVAPGGEETFVPVKRAMDTRFFPTKAMLHAMLQGYVFRRIGQSVSQTGDPIPRHVYHISHKLPVALLLMDEHYTGKTSMAKTVLRPDMPCLAGDAVYRKIASGELAVSEQLRPFFAVDPATGHLNSAAATSCVCRAGLLPELLAVFANMAGKRDFALDNYVPAAYREAARSILRDAGYFVADLSIAQAKTTDWIRVRPPFAQYQAYARHLEQQGLVDEQAYLRANPDVAKAVAEGKMPNAQFHYFHFGRREGRKRQ
jgi:SAM-dependent methyltransferase